MTFEELVETARLDPGIVGLILTGSRGRSFAVTDESDWDVRLVVRDDVVDDYRTRFATPRGSDVEVVVLSLAELEEAGELATGSAWDRYSYARARVEVDDDAGTIARLVEAKSELSPAATRSLAAECLDDYVNAYYRAAKNRRAGLPVESRLDAAESIPPLLGFLFAAHGRVRPFNRFLRFELESRPLPGQSWSTDALLSRLEAIRAGDLAEQRQMFRAVEELALEKGLGHVLDGWEPDLEWLRGAADSRVEHAFTAVDEQSDPSAWIEVLDRVRREPAYAAYKRRVVELLEPVAARRYLDVGTGTGADALELAARFDVGVVGIDASTTMVEEARRRGLDDALVAKAEALPFAAGSFDGSWADRTFQHLDDPEAALAEMVRVTKPGGRIVVADPDYDTQVVDVPDRDLARKVLRFRADELLRNGSLAHRMGGLFGHAGILDVSVEPVPVVLRDPTALDNAMGLRDWAAVAHERGILSAEDVATWREMIDEAASRGHFLYAFTIFITAGTRS